MNVTSHRGAVLLIVPLLWTQSACAHGIAGTITFDDPAVADEFILLTSTISITSFKEATSLKAASTALSRGCSRLL